jgi:hypothetical protein
MTNPARELADLLEQWRTIPTGGTVHTVRGTHTDSLDSWRRQVRAAVLLHDVDRSLEALAAAQRDVSHYTRLLPRWTAAVFVPDRHWGQSSNSAGQLFDQVDLDMLRAVADILDLSKIVVTLDGPTVRRSVDALNEVLDALTDDRLGLSIVEQRYLFDLIGSCRAVLEEATTFGAVDLLRRIHELIGVLNMLADTLERDPETEDLASRIRRAAKKVAPYLAFGAKAAAGAVGAGADLLQITDGF